MMGVGVGKWVGKHKSRETCPPRPDCHYCQGNRLPRRWLDNGCNWSVCDAQTCRMRAYPRKKSFTYAAETGWRRACKRIHYRYPHILQIWRTPSCASWMQPLSCNILRTSLRSTRHLEYTSSQPIRRVIHKRIRKLI